MLQVSTCNNVVDYSTATGERTLPFTFTLNLNDSILNPTEGQHQTFCYDVQGVGKTTVSCANLSYFILGICGGITLDSLKEVSVSIDGVPQKVVLGDNVQIKTTEQPDDTTKCVGLKFNFPLNKVSGHMQVTFSLKDPYTVGPVNVCAYGETVTATGEKICGPACGGGGESCSSVFYQNETVCVPVTVTPYANPGVATATCCGKPKVTAGATCSGGKGACTFTVTQKVCIEVPITFGADIDTGSAYVDCGTVSETPCECQTEETATEETPDTTKSIRERRMFGR